MRYQGGKFRLRKDICNVLNQYRREGQLFVDLFCGGGSIVREMSNPRLANDVCKPLIVMYKALLDGWVPPKNLNEQAYKIIKARMDLDHPITAFAGFFCSFGGKWFGGYARARQVERNYVTNAHNSCMRLLEVVKGVEFISMDYRDLLLQHRFKDCMIYCDPPYMGTTGYGFCKGFNHELFWYVMRWLSYDNLVFISEYNAPDDFISVLRINRSVGLGSRDVDTIKDTVADNIFVYEGGMFIKTKMKQFDMYGSTR